MECISAPVILHLSSFLRKVIYECSPVTSLQEAAAALLSTKLFAQAEAGFFIPIGRAHS